MKTASRRLTEASAFDSFFYDRFPLSRPGERVLSLYASKHLTPGRLAKQSICVYGRGGNFNSLAPAGSDLAVLELRGGTHLVVRQAERPPEPRTGAPFDLMFDDIEATRRIFEEKGLSPSSIRRGRIHDSFEVIEPDGWVITINSSHASGQPI